MFDSNRDENIQNRTRAKETWVELEKKATTQQRNTEIYGRNIDEEKTHSKLTALEIQTKPIETESNNSYIFHSKYPCLSQYTCSGAVLNECSI